MTFSLTGQSCKRAQEEPVANVEEKVVEKTKEQPKGKYVNRMKVDSKDAQLKLVVGSDNVHSIILENSIPLRGAQFTLAGAQIANVSTTERTKGFIANFNKESGGVILVHTTGGKIKAGTGPIAEIVCEKGGTPSLSNIKLAK
jgi:hypothetical protein